MSSAIADILFKSGTTSVPSAESIEKTEIRIIRFWSVSPRIRNDAKKADKKIFTAVNFFTQLCDFFKVYSQKPK